MSTTLVLGGTRSGKSRYAQSLLPGDGPVTFIAPGPKATSDDPEWARRVRRHQQDRPDGWTTVETTALTRAVLHARGPVLIDCLGTWVTSTIDEAQLWEKPQQAMELIEERVAELAALWALAPYESVAVTNEVGMAVVPATSSGRLFQDALGRVNATMSAASKRVHLVIAGRVLDLSDAPALT